MNPKSSYVTKRRILTDQGDTDAITGTPLTTKDMALVDRSRIVPKSEGGTLDSGNVRVIHPLENYRLHGNYRERSPELTALKAVFDSRRKIMKLKLGINNQILAYKRETDTPDVDTLVFLEGELERVDTRLREIDKDLASGIKHLDDPLVKAALGVPGVGPITVAALTVFVDLEVAATPSALWKYCGLHRASHERYEKGVKGSGGNKTLRTILWNTACVMVKLGEGNEYRKVYDQVKHRLSHSEKLTMTRTTEGKLVEAMWKDTKPGHRHGAALRAVMKHILADYWLVGREIYGMRTRPLYVEEYLGHSGIISPAERGWKWVKVGLEQST